MSSFTSSSAQESTSCLPPSLQPQPQAQSAAPTPEQSASAVGNTPNPIPTPSLTDKPSSSIFARSETAPVHNVPMRVIRRPLPSELDEEKVQAFMREMEAGDTFTPIELIKVKAPLKSNPSGPAAVFYFAMGGCHRYEATKRLELETIRAKIIEVPASQMRVYLGAGSPF